jgi:hypothetical protein
LHIKRFFTVVTLATIAFSSPTHAKELSGADALALLNGKNLNCTADGKNVTINFGAPNAKGRIKFKVTMDGRTISNGYRMTKKGTLVNDKTNVPRSVSTGAGGTIILKGRGVPDAVCK